MIVFIDYQNVHGWARRRFFGYGVSPAQGHVDPLRVGQLLCRRRRFESELQQVRVYRGRPNPERQGGAARANDRQTDHWAKSPLVEVVRRNVYYPPKWPEQAAQEKGIDVAIAVDMIRLAMQGQMDAAILFSSDTDLLPALETLRDLELCHVEVAAWVKGHRLRFGQSEEPWSHNIGKEEYLTLQDKTDYSEHPDAESAEVGETPA